MKYNYHSKSIVLWVLSITVLLIPHLLLADNPPAFPGAEGFGRYTTGGRGGTVYHVTSLDDDGSEGTLRWAVKKSGTRTIVFDVSGTIHLTSQLDLRNDNVTIAGQTAPGDGICIADYPFVIKASNVIIRFMRFRLGNLNVADHEGDGLGAMDQANIIVDHCSVSWSIDECCSILGNENTTLQWSIISQSLRNSGHAKGAHGYGGNWGGSGASFHHNLMCHHDSRTPRLGPRASTQTDERVDMRNNVFYNWCGNGCYGGEGMNVNIVNNYYKPGPGTKQRSSLIQTRIASIGVRTTEYCERYPAYAPMEHVWGTFFADGNYFNEHSDVTADNWTKGIYAQTTNGSSVDYLYTTETKNNMKLSSSINYLATTTHTAEMAYERVLEYAGASLSRDWVDALMVYDTKNGVASYTGSGSGNKPGIIDNQDDNKPADATADWSAWPTLNSTSTPLDTDQDGMPDTWETANGLNVNDPTDGSSTNSDGYTMLEVYMNSLVTDIMDGGNEGGTITEGEDTAENTVVTLSQSTYNGVAGASSPWDFANNYSISNSNGKNYSTGNEDGIKYSSGVQYTVNLPSDIQVESLTFVGYNNYSGADAYIGELNGTSFDETDYVFTQKDNSGNYTMCSNKIQLSSPASGSFTFTVEGKQCVLSILLSTSEIITTSMDNTNEDDIQLNPYGLVNVYGIDGRVVRYQVVRQDAIKNLPNGIYIVDGKKVGIFRK